jgi:hypothetical protein
MATFFWVKSYGKYHPQKWHFPHTDLQNSYWKDYIVASRELSPEEAQLTLDQLAAKYPHPVEEEEK